MAGYFSRLSYSFGNEDWSTEAKALQVRPGDRVACITASGDRPLHILLHDCAEVVAIDANPAQNHLLNLKVAALGQLSYEEYLAFLGALPHPERLAVLHRLNPLLPPEARHFWNSNSDMIKKGVLFQGMT